MDNGPDHNIYEAKVPYRYRPYPRLRYHLDGRKRIVNNETEEKALGPGWGGPENIPAAPEPVPVAAPVIPEDDPEDMPTQEIIPQSEKPRKR